MSPAHRPPAKKAAEAAPPRLPSSGHVSSQLAPPWPFDPQVTALIRAGYNPAWKPNTSLEKQPPEQPQRQQSSNLRSDNERNGAGLHVAAAASANKSTQNNNNSKKNTPSKMAEPRARVARHKGQMNFSSERGCSHSCVAKPAEPEI